MMIIPANLDSGVARALEILGRRLDGEVRSRECGGAEEVENLREQTPGKDVGDESSDKALPKKSAEKPWYEEDEEDEEDEEEKGEREDD